MLDTLAYSTAPVWEVDDRLYAYDYDEIIQWSGEDFGDSSSWSAAPDPGVPFFMSDAHGLGDAVWAIGHSGQVVVLEGDSVGIETPSSDAPVLFKTVWAAADEVFVGGDDGVVLHRHRNTDWQTVPIPSSERITRIRGDGAGRVFALDGDGALFELVRE